MTVIDPRKIDMVKSAHRHLPIQVGTDIALINAMMHVIIEEKLYNAEFIAKHTAEFDSLKAKVKDIYTRICSIDYWTFCRGYYRDSARICYS